MIGDSIYQHPDLVHTVSRDDDGDAAYCVWRGDSYMGSYEDVWEAIDACNKLGDSDVCCDGVLPARLVNRLRIMFDREWSDVDDEPDYVRGVAILDALAIAERLL